jgi:hypothetical protein
MSHVRCIGVRGSGPRVNGCHLPVPAAPAGTAINSGRFTVPPALGGKIVRAYDDVLARDIGTNDGIPVLPTVEFSATAALIRTAPLRAGAHPIV